MRNRTECIQEAERCERSAGTAWDDGIRSTFKAIASAWREIADFEVKASAKPEPDRKSDPPPPFFD